MDTQPVPGFPVHTSILTEAAYVPVEESAFVLKFSRVRRAYRASSLDGGGVWRRRADRSKVEHGQRRNNASAGEVEHVE